VLTSATLMARAAATEEAIELARSTHSLGVGCHVVLVDGEPVLRAHDLPTLVDRARVASDRRSAHFFSSFSRGASALRIEAEAAAQIALLQNRGLRLTTSTPTSTPTCFPPCCGRCCARRVQQNSRSAHPFEQSGVCVLLLTRVTAPHGSKPAAAA